MDTNPTKPQPATLSVSQAAAILGISRSLAYELVARGEIPSLRLGRRIVVPRNQLMRLVEGNAAEPRSA